VEHVVAVVRRKHRGLVAHEDDAAERLLLPNERAIEPQITAIYRRFGLPTPTSA
jgi:hypothetical protein